MLTIDEETLGKLLTCSVRYALGRQSYIVGSVCSTVRSYAHNVDKLVLAVIITSIEEEEKFGYGTEYHKQKWMELLAYLKEIVDTPEKKSIYEFGAGTNDFG